MAVTKTGNARRISVDSSSKSPSSPVLMASSALASPPLTPPSPKASVGATPKKDKDSVWSVEERHSDFIWKHNDEPHATRRREMLRKYPQIRELMRHEPLTKYVVVSEVIVQFALAILLRDQLWTPQFWITAYVIGGTITSALLLSVHEITHFLAFKSFFPNKVLACIANLPIVLPFCVDFKRYHMDHHRFQGVDGIDGDLPTKLEGILFNSTIGKLFFCTFQVLFYAIRPKLVATSRTFKMPTTAWEWITSWYTMNYVIQFSVIYATFHFFGIVPIVYLAASVLLGGSLHPMAGHYIAEHYVTDPNIETYSYYGWMNILAFNVGYHNEHHDFPNIPWTLLPELRKIAPEYYETLPQVKSWTGTIYNFITKDGMGPYSRIKRTEEDAKRCQKAAVKVGKDVDCNKED